MLPAVLDNVEAEVCYKMAGCILILALSSEIFLISSSDCEARSQHWRSIGLGLFRCSHMPTLIPISYVLTHKERPHSYRLIPCLVGAHASHSPFNPCVAVMAETVCPKRSRSPV